MEFVCLVIFVTFCIVQLQEKAKKRWIFIEIQQ